MSLSPAVNLAVVSPVDVSDIQGCYFSVLFFYLFPRSFYSVQLNKYLIVSYFCRWGHKDK